ncbi:recombination protein NinG [Pseudomonas sp. SO81]|uniref:recombination protein NinG n=1 Tax=Pseudomonas sp. SO81 TaxID=2983246 RepID=UPI0025A3DD39|nr:recombination protein NinG [Pseudomonas sp. SO81]WJN61341.1 Phage recombination protein NinG [Pseudomonas sp. SO81]
MLSARQPLKAISAKPKKCAVRSCRAPFIPKQSFQTWCSPECGLAIAKAKQDKQRVAIEQVERREIRAAKERVKPRAEHMKEAQSAFNAWVRERDILLPCISCGRHHQGKYDAGHYRTVGSNPALRFEPLNCHKQCVPCNQHKSGDIVNYRINLVQRIGAEKVAWLEGPHEPKKYSIEDLKAIKARYRELVRVMRKEQGVHG